MSLPAVRLGRRLRVATATGTWVLDTVVCRFCGEHLGCVEPAVGDLGVGWWRPQGFWRGRDGVWRLSRRHTQAQSVAERHAHPASNGRPEVYRVGVEGPLLIECPAGHESGGVQVVTDDLGPLDIVAAR